MSGNKSPPSMRIQAQDTKDSAVNQLYLNAKIADPRVRSCLSPVHHTHDHARVCSQPPHCPPHSALHARAHCPFYHMPHFKSDSISVLIVFLFTVLPSFLPSFLPSYRSQDEAIRAAYLAEKAAQQAQEQDAVPARPYPPPSYLFLKD
jgi:hypothetical protein